MNPRLFVYTIDFEFHFDDVVETVQNVLNGMIMETMR